LFIRNVINKLYHKKIIDKKTYESVKNLYNVDPEISTSGLKWMYGRV